MLTIRKTDWYAQLIIMIGMAISIAPLFFYGILVSLFITGVIQLLSAALNTKSFYNNGLANKINKYWTFTIFDLLILAILFLPVNKDLAQVLFIFSVTAAAVISVYYLVIYKKLIDILELRNELAGFTKS